MTAPLEPARPTLMVVIASIRDGRVGLPVGQWFESVARAHAGFDVSLVDLKELALPLMTEPNHPRLKQYTQETTWQWSRMVESADAFVFVMPEYNHGVSAPLINAIDYLFQEWHDKTAGIVSYGGVSGGLRAAQHLKPVLSTVGLHTVVEAVSIQMVRNHVHDGVFAPDQHATASADAMLDAMLRTDAALRTLRDAA